MREKIRNSLTRGLRSGLRSAWWMCKMMIPITALVALMRWAGVIDILSRWLTPAFEFMGLSGQAVIVFLTNALSNLYSGVAVIATLNLDYRQATILAIMGLICHNLIVESIIQKKAGANVWYMVVLRIGVSLIAGVVLNWILPIDYTGFITIETAAAATTFGQIASEWGLSMLKLIPMIFALVIGLNILQQLLREFRLIDLLTIPLRPFIAAMGLARETSFLWIVLNTLGLAYGGGVMIAELQEGQIAKRQARLLNTNAAVTHSLLEDTLIFVAVGLSFFWLVVPRLLLSVMAVWSERLYYKIKDKRATR